MQDCYVGDIGDFGKFGLLKYLFSEGNWKLGIIWYKMPDDQHNNDGRHTDYLLFPQNNRYREYHHCAPKLYADLKKIVENNNRRIVELERKKTPLNLTKYYSESVDFRNLTSSKRTAERKLWFKNALEAVDGCNAIFLDPDNGIKNLDSYSHINSGKYASHEEIKAIVDKCEICVVYHHLNFQHSHTAQIMEKINELNVLNNKSVETFALRWRRYVPRAYFIICKKNMKEDIRKRLNLFLDSSWGIHWNRQIYDSQSCHNVSPSKQAGFKPPEYKCPIQLCVPHHQIFYGSRSGLDAHVASVKRHPEWHPKIKDGKKRKELFRMEFPDWFNND